MTGLKLRSNLSGLLLILTSSIESEAFRSPDIDLIHHSLATDGEGLVVEPVKKEISPLWVESEGRIVGLRILNENSNNIASNLCPPWHTPPSAILLSQ